MHICERKEYFLRENVSGAENKECTFRFEANEAGLIFFFSVRDEDVISPFREDNEDIWQADAVEIFLSPDGDLVRYKEMEVSPYGIRFFADICNADGKTPQIYKIAPAFEAKAERTQAGYRVRIQISFAALGVSDIRKIKLNAFRLDKKADGRQLLYALGPTFCESFHRAAYFMNLEAEHEVTG